MIDAIITHGLAFWLGGFMGFLAMAICVAARDGGQ